MITYLDRRKSTEKIQKEIQNISKQNELIKNEIDLFNSKDIFLIERLARELGFMKPGELIFNFEDEKPKRYDKSDSLK